MSDPGAPRFRVLDTKSALLSLPTFGDRYAHLIAALVAKHHREIVSRPILIVDVRRNDGGSDASYAPLLPLFAANTTRTIGAEFLATPDNIAASEAVCKLPTVSAKACSKFMAPVLEAMRAAPAGTYVLPANERAVEVETPERVLGNPRRIAVLIDRACGSSCEEFVLLVRQSFKVKTFGRPTYGALDYSNLRPHDLPSGKRRLFYATSRSLRLPLFRVDPAGIPPDQFLPSPANDTAFAAEVETVRRILAF
jgi:C-terminal processing protease CtpA/Prc